MTDGPTDHRTGEPPRRAQPHVRMEAEGAVPYAVLDTRRRGQALARYRTLPVASVLNSPLATGMGFWSVNPYVGCEFGCSYCYARFAHRYVTERAPSHGAAPWDDDAFEREIFVKAGAAEVLALTLKPARVGGHAIVIGTATDPYQPAERSYGITRRVLECLAQFHGLHVAIITKSPLITRDVDVLRRFAARNTLTVCVSLIAADAPLVRRLEPRTPVPAVRLRALTQLVGAGIRAGIMMAPVVPGITDDVPHLTALVRAARAAGAAFVRADPLRLNASIRRRFLPVVAEHWPELLPRYERAFDARGVVTPAYAAALQRRLGRVRQECGVGDGQEGTEGTEGTDGTARSGRLEWDHVLQQELAL